MPMHPSLALISTILGGLLVTGAGALFARWLAGKPQRDADAERARAAQDAILGKPEVRDLGGGIIEEQQPGLVDRTATLERAVALIANQDARIKTVEQHQAAADIRFDGIEQTIGLLIGTKFKDGADAMLAAVEKQQADTIDEPTEAT